MDSSAKACRISSHWLEIMFGISEYGFLKDIGTQDSRWTDHRKSKEPTSLPWEWIHFIWCTMIWVISVRWSWSRSSQWSAAMQLFLNFIFYLLQNPTVNPDFKIYIHISQLNIPKVTSWHFLHKFNTYTCSWL